MRSDNGFKIVTLKCPECGYILYSNNCDLITFHWISSIRGRAVRMTSYAHASMKCNECCKISPLPDLYCVGYNDNTLFARIHRFDFASYESLKKGFENVEMLLSERMVKLQWGKRLTP